MLRETLLESILENSSSHRMSRVQLSSTAAASAGSEACITVTSARWRRKRCSSRLWHDGETPPISHLELVHGAVEVQEGLPDVHLPQPRSIGYKPGNISTDADSTGNTQVAGASTRSTVSHLHIVRRQLSGRQRQRPARRLQHGHGEAHAAGGVVVARGRHLRLHHHLPPVHALQVQQEAAFNCKQPSRLHAKIRLLTAAAAVTTTMCTP